MKITNAILIAAIYIFMAACGQQKTSESNSVNEPATEKNLQKINIKELDKNAVSLIADNWLVVTAGNETDFNQMTISWGAIGNLWQSPAVTIYIRDSRYTYSYIENNDYFTLCAFPEEYRDQVQLIGTKSGRDIDKIQATGLTPKITDLGNIYYEEAYLVIECQKTYYNDIIPANITDPQGIKMYQDEESVHRMYIGKIINAWEKK